MDNIWYFVIAYIVVSTIWIAIEMINAPLMDDDYGVEYKEDKDEE